MAKGESTATIYRVIVASDLRPDPDDTSKPLANLVVDAKVTLVHGPLAGWMKVSFVDGDGTTSLGWVRGECLQAAQREPIKLYDEPLGVAQDVVGAIIDIRIRLPGWNKVDVVLEDGAARAGWVQAALQPDGSGTTKGRGRQGSDKPQLVLGPNAIYQDHLITASARSGIDSAALAALINAEAAKLSGGLWNANSKAPKSSSTAAGLTQFLDDTWIAEARRRNTLLNERARSLGLVDSANAVVAGQKQRLLDLRFDPELSIVTAAEYGRANLDALVAAGLVEDGLGDDERARFIYLAHHEGLAGAKAFLANKASFSYSDVVRQVGKDKAKVLVDKAGGDTTAAYRSWLDAYMDEKIRPSDFRASAPGGSGAGSGTPALKDFAGPSIPIAELSQRTALAKAIQWRLTELGYLDPPADGRFGPVSTWALGAFCELNELTIGEGFSTTIARALAAPRARLPTLARTGTWFDKVIAFMAQRAYFINRHPDCLNIVYIEGVNPGGTLNDDAPNIFNDLRIVFGIDAQGKPRLDGVWDGTTEPGRVWTESPMNPKGAARIAFNQYKSWAVGTHHPGTASAHEALVQVEPVSVFRDLNKDYKRTGDFQDTGLFGINQHWGYDAPAGDLGRTSAGCLVGRTKAGHRDFMRIVKRDPRYAANGGYRFLTAIMAGHEVLK